MNHNAIETVLGAVVIIAAAVFLVFGLNAASIKKTDGYEVTANFSKVDGLAPGIDVRLSGVKIGSIVKTELDPKTFLAKVTMTIADSIQLPTDTVAKVSSESLLGGKFLALEPGGDDAVIKRGGQIQYTQASVNLEEMIGKFIFSAADSKNDKKPVDAPPAHDNTAAAPAEDKPAAAGGFSSDY